MTPTRDQLEYAVSQYIDGTLPPLESAALEERFAVDAEARAVLEEYRALDRALKTSLPEPAVAWDRLAAHLSDAVSRAEAPVRHYSLRTITRVAGEVSASVTDRRTAAGITSSWAASAPSPSSKSKRR